MLTVADQFRVQQLHVIVGATTAWERGGRRGPRPFPGVQLLLVPLVATACAVIGEAQRAAWWRDEGQHALAEVLAANPELAGH